MPSPLSYRDGSLRAFGHPLHVLLVHIPMGLWPLVFPLELAGWLGWDEGWRLAFRVNALALAAALPAAATGLIDLIGLRSGSAAERAGNLHLAAMLAAAALFGGELCFHPPGAVLAGTRAFFNLGIALLGSAALFYGGWLGGELVLRHGAGRIGEEGERGREREAG